MNNMRFIDLHCDTIVCEVHRSCGKKNLRSNPEGHLDLLRMKEGGAPGSFSTLRRIAMKRRSLRTATSSPLR